jgi:hypothetical protein
MEELPDNIRLLYEYWMGLAGGKAPDRSLVDPERLKPILAYILLVEFQDDPFRVRYRLTGTIVDRMTGMNITGRWLDEFATGRFVGPIQYIESCYREARDTGRHFIGHYDWPIDNEMLVDTMMGLFPVCIAGRVRQCLSIEHYGKYEFQRRPIDWRPALNYRI